MRKIEDSLDEECLWGKRPTSDGLGRIMQGSDIRSKTQMTMKEARGLGEQ